MNNYNLKSRLARKEAQRSYQRLIWATLGTIVLIVVIIFGGIPALVKFSAIMGDVKSSNQPITSQNTDNPLLPPRLEPLPDATNNSQITLSGFAQPGKDVEIFLNDDLAGKTTVGADGKFLFSNLSLTEGENRIRAYTADGEVKSEASGTIFITYKKTAPKLEITKPDDDSSFSGESKTIRIEGQTDPENSVTINDRWAIVSSTGSFYASFTLSDGENNLKIKALDSAGNETTVERKVTYSP